MVNCPVIDADGHVLEKEKYIRKYLEAPWNKRSTALRTRDQPWDANLFDSFEMAVRWEDLSPREQIDEWHAVMEREGMVKAICFPTRVGQRFEDSGAGFRAGGGARVQYALCQGV
jgi:hypothetical protein